MKMTSKQYNKIGNKRGRGATIPASSKPALIYHGYIMRSKWEAEYAAYLETLRAAGEILMSG